jgi:hypothetical protein
VNELQDRPLPPANAYWVMRRVLPDDYFFTADEPSHHTHYHLDVRGNDQVTCTYAVPQDQAGWINIALGQERQAGHISHFGFRVIPKRGGQ